jgi:hypothetical protein
MDKDMTAKELKKIISTTCKKVMKKRGFGYVDIEVNYGLPYISVGMNGCEFFSQGEDAGEIINGVKEVAHKLGLSFNTCLVWYLEGAGVWS